MNTSKQDRAVNELVEKLMGPGMDVRSDRLWHLPGSPVRVVARFPDIPERFVALIDEDGRRL